MSFAAFRSRLLFHALVFVVFGSSLLAAGSHIVSATLSSSPRPDEMKAGAQDEALAREFDLLRRLPGGGELSDDRYAEARAALCRAYRGTDVDKGWLPLGPGGADAATDPCQTKEGAPFAGAVNEAPLVSGAVSSDGGTWLGGAGKKGVWLGTKAGWRRLLDGFGGFVGAGSEDLRIIYAAGEGLALRKSVDGGQSFSATHQGIADSGLLIAPFAIDPVEPQRLWAGGRMLWRTVDGAENWAQASAVVAGSNASKVSVIAVAATNPNLALAGTSEGFIHRADAALSAGAETSWPFAQPRRGYVSSITFDPADENVVYATYSTFGGAHVWRSADGGASWAPIEGAGEAALPDTPTHALAIDPADRRRMFVGTDLGVFVTGDGGASWRWARAGFGDAVVESLVLQRGEGAPSLFAFTRGRGVWRLTLAQAAEPQQSCEYTFTPYAQTFESAGGEGGVDVAARGSGSCNWEARSEVDWIRLNNNTGSGNGRITFTVAANATSQTRGGRIVIGSRETLVFQTGAGGNCSATPITAGQPANGQLTANDCPITRRAFYYTDPYYGDRYSFNGRAGDLISIALTSAAFEPYIYLVGPNGSVVAETNFSSSERNVARIPVGGGFFILPSTGAYIIEATSSRSRSVGAYQLLLNAAPSGCGNYALAATGQRFDAEGGGGRVQVSAASGCPWTANSTVEWARVTAGANGSGNQFVSFTLSPNVANQARSGRLEIAGQAFTIEQAGVGGSCTVKPLEPNKTVRSSLSDADCRASQTSFDPYTSERYSFTATAGQPIALQAVPLSSPFQPRLTLTSAAGAALSGATAQIPADGGSFNIPSSGQYFVEVTPADTFTTNRFGSYALTLFTPTPGCDYALSPSSQGFEPSGGAGVVNLAANAGCAWVALSDVEWITVADTQGSGGGAINFTVAANTTNRLRRGGVTVNGRTAVIEQAGVGGSCAIRPIMPGQTVMGALNEADCRSRFRGDSGTYFADRYSFTANAGQQVALSVTEQIFPVITLVDGAGRTIGQGGRVPGQGFLPLPADGEYVIEVTANSGLSVSGDYSLTFNLVPAGCGYRIAPSAQRFEASGGGGSVDVTATTGCAWTARVGSSEVNWVTITSGASGVGAGKVEFSVAANTGNQFRRAALSVAGQDFIVEQAGANGNCAAQPITPGQIVAGRITAGDCPGPPNINEVAFPTDSYTFMANAGDQVAITALVTPPASISSGLAIRLVSPTGSQVAASNIRLPSFGDFQTLPASGTYTIEITANFTPSGGGFFPYTVEMTLAPGGCSYLLTTAQQKFEAAGGAGSVDVIAGALCPWAARSSADWITITSGASGRGDGKVEFTVAANTTNRSRRGAIVIAEEVFTVEQGGAGGSCAVAPILAGQNVNGVLNNADCRTTPFGGSSTSATDTYSFTGNAGEQVAITVSTASVYLFLRDSRGARLTESFNEIRLPRTGFFTLPYSGTYLIEAISRTGIDLNYSLTLDLAPGFCSYAVAPSLQSVSAAGGALSFDVIAPAGCPWRAINSDNWVMITTQSGAGPGKVELTVAANTQNNLRTATINVGNARFIVEQAGANGNCAPEPITIGQTVNGNVSGSDCRSVRTLPNTDSSSSIFRADRYLLDFTAGQQFSIEAASTVFTPFISVLDPNGVVILQGRERLPIGGGFLTLPATGKYVVEISPESSGSGNYTLRLRAPTECEISLTPSAQIFERSGGSGALTIVTGAGCAWMAASEVSWITPGGATSGSGPGAVTFTVASNTGSNRRSGAIRVGNQTLTITQAGAAGVCAPTPIAAGQLVTGTLARGDCQARFGGSFSSFGGGFTLNELADYYTFQGRAGETINFSPGDAPIIVVAPNGLPLNPPANIAPQPRYFPMTLPASGAYTLEYSRNSVGAYSFTLLSTVGSCNYVVSSPSRDRFEAGGGGFTVNVVTSADCAWRVEETAEWVTILSGGEGRGSGVVEFVVAPNTGEARIDDFRVAGQPVRIQQAGPQGSCAAVQIAPNQTVRGTLSRSDCNNTDRFNFNGRAGEQIALTLAGDTSSISVSVFGPNGESVSPSSLATLPANGVYTIELRATVGFTVNYSLSLSIISNGCAFALSETSASFESVGGAGGFNVTAGASCAWIASSDADWVNITAGASGTGNGRVVFTVAANNGIFSRFARILVAGRVYTVQQSGLGGVCSTMAIQPNQTVVSSVDEADCVAFFDQGRAVFGESYSFNGKAGEQLITNLTGLSGATLELFGPDGRRLLGATGPTSVSPPVLRVRVPDSGFYTLPADGAYLIRVLVSSLNFSLGDDYRLALTLVPATCVYTVGPTPQIFDSGGGQGSVTVSAGAGCAWIASAEDSWATITSAMSGSSAGAINFTVAANNETFSRRTRINVANRAVVIEQAGQGGNCQPRPITSGATVAGEITSSDCLSRVTFGRARLHTFSGKRGDQLALFGGATSSFGGEFALTLTLFNVDGAALLSARTTRLPLGGGYFTLPADGTYTVESATESTTSDRTPYTLTLQMFSAGCGYSLSATAQTFMAEGGAGSIDVITGADCVWNASSGVSWVTIKPGSVSGKGGGKVEFTVAANSSNQYRSGALVIAGRSFTVEQAGGGGNCAPLPIASGQTVNASWSVGDCPPRYALLAGSSGRADNFSFSGRSGERVILSLTRSGTGAGDSFITLLAPDGSLLQQVRAGRLPAGSGAFVLPVTGVYLIEAATNFISSAVNYSLTLDAQAPCVFNVAPADVLVSAAGGPSGVTVSAAGGCDWLAQSETEWITVAAANSYGSGSGAAAFTVAPNTGRTFRSGKLTVGGQNVTVTQAGAAVTVSAASFGGDEFAPESLVTTFGVELASGTPGAPSTKANIVDSAGAVREAQVLFASANQVNFQIPAGTALGPATVIISSATNIASSSVRIAPVAPGLFAANGDGSGAATGYALRIKADGSRSVEPIARFDATSQRFVPAPIDLGPEGEQVFLIGFGTGFSGRSSLDNTRVSVGGVTAPLNFAGAQGQFNGLDQFNALLPRSLAGRGEVDVVLTADGKSSNAVKIVIR